MKQKDVIRRWSLSALVILVPMLAWGEGKLCAYPVGECHLYRLQLRDKAGSPYSLSNPEEFLSMKSVERRYRQGLPIDSTDLPISPYYLQNLAESGIKVVSRSKWNNTVVVALPEPDDRGTLRDIPFVTNVVHLFSAPDSIEDSVRERLVQETGTLNAKDSLQTSHTSDFYGKAFEQIKMLRGEKLHQAGYRGKGMTIAVLDGGFMNVDSMEMLKNVRIVGACDFVYPPSDDIFSERDHGTMVLSTMAVNRPDTMVGTAPEAQYLLLRTEDNRTESLAEEDFWAEAVEFADSMGVDILNSSLGYHHFDRSLGDHLYRDLDGKTSICSRSAGLVAHKGMILVTSAGNEGQGTWKKINVPGDAADVLTVGAVNNQSMNAGFSSVGPSADGRVKPDVMAMGYRSAVVNGKGQLTTANGTSFSSPITCGMVACLWQALPRKTALEIIDLVRRAGHQSDTPDNIFGYGIPDFWKALEYGRINETEKR